jgi:small conductance mechanosensitive channel
MTVMSKLPNPLTDTRFAANLIAIHGLIVALVLVCLLLRRWLARGGNNLGERTGLHWLDAVGQEVVRRGRRLLLWVTLMAAAMLAVAGVGYHFTGRDIRADLIAWHHRLTTEDWMQLGRQASAIVVLALLAWLCARGLRRLRAALTDRVTACLGCAGNEEDLGRCVGLMVSFLSAAVGLVALRVGCRILHAGRDLGAVVVLLLHLLAILAAARLLPLVCKALSPNLAALGTRYLGRSKFHRYWERLTRLIPLGERCFEAAVYVLAAWWTFRELHVITGETDFGSTFGPRLVKCIGIFFGTRVVIELLQVLLNQAFGLYSEDRHISQKARTLVPLLNSVLQYVLYFGSVVMTLGVLGLDTGPILAGAGILGLAVGLGAQNLVTDLVSGFFILFESQFLVGDYVEIGEARGIVEAVGIRLTQVRDGRGKLYLIPNGQIKGVVNYSKGYVNAVVDVRAASGSDLETIIRAMTEAGRRLRQTRHEVLADTQIQGLVELGASEMTVRAVTKVRPGTHEALENEYRRLLKQVFDQKQTTDVATKVAA